MINLSNKFAEMGARVKVEALKQDPFRPINSNSLVRIDVLKDNEGEYFDLRKRKNVDLQVLDVQRKDRHLLLTAKNLDPKAYKDPVSTFLCGHDERHWFACAIPETANAVKVEQAKQALKPPEVVSFEQREGVRTKNLHKRHRKLSSGKKIHRQGEFMFLPEPNFKPDLEMAVLTKEPLQRGRSKPHMAEFLYRTGGERVYVSHEHSNGLSQTEYNKFVKDNPVKAKRIGWRVMVRDARVYVKGRIRHVDHSTVDLGNIWHRVAISTEGKARAAEQVAFLD